MKVLEAVPTAKVMVIGDIMLDKYIHGGVFRISPEAPVPVLKAEKDVDKLGGAANVADNVAMLNAHCVIVGAAGADIYRDTVAEMFEDLGVQNFLKDSGKRTTTKIRVIGERQQIVRIDYEDILNKDNPALEKIAAKAKELMPWMDAVVLSDYGKGVVSADVAKKIIEEAARLGKICIVDPKGADWTKYTGATIVTPNVKELGEVAGAKIKNTDEEIVLYATAVRERYKLKYLVVTRSEKGITIIGENLIKHLPTEAQEVFDVSGAGDTVVATMACCLGGGADIEEAVRLANLAAGIVVSKVGTVSVTYAELLRATLKDSSVAVSAEEVAEIITPLRQYGKTVVFTNGCFDILHRGHVDYLKKARKLGDMLIVGLNSDESVKRIKGPERPVNSQEDRAFVLASLGCVDYVVIFDEDTPARLINYLKPDILVKGGDYLPEEVVGREDSGKVVIIDFVNGYSTTSTIEKLRKGD